ncbi:hypothetical protein GOBAR_DD12025 [Gossypium barbadense]|nr:hypothetical protein GOBAR_DD12025 [Gossypium barbadense]
MVSLNILQSLTLQIHTHNYKMLLGSEVLTLAYRLHFKAMYSVVNTKALLRSPKGETLLIESDTSRSHTTIPRTIQRHEINLPDRWKLEGATDPVAPTPIRNTSLSEISQHQDGTVELIFNMPRRMPPRHSFEIGSTSTTFRRLNLEEELNPETQTADFRTARASVSSIPTTFRTNLQGIDNSSNIAQPIYARQEESPQNSPNMSLPYSSMTNNKHFYSNKNNILQEYYEFMNTHKIHIKFFEWFQEYYSESVNTIKHNTRWQTNKGEVESQHPPLIEVQYLHKNIGIKANPLITRTLDV